MKELLTATRTTLRHLLVLALLVGLAACAPADAPLPTLAVLPSPIATADTQPQTLADQTTGAQTAPEDAQVIATTPPPANELAELGETLPNATPAPPLTSASDAPDLPASAPAISLPPSQPVPDQVVITFSAGASTAEREAYIATLGGRTIKRFEIAGQETVVVQGAGLSPDTLPPAPVVALSEPDYLVSAQLGSTPNDPYFPFQWALSMMQVPQVWPLLPAEPLAITVAVIDSGICAGHPELAGRLLPGWDFVQGDDNPQDVYGHGCAVAGVIAANIDNNQGLAGVAPNARILPVRVLDDTGMGTYSAVAQGIVWATDQGAHILNLSLGGTTTSSVLQNAVNYALARGVLVIAAAGNTGDSTMSYPAAFPGVISVGSVTSTGQPSSFSSTHPSIRIWAPGSGIISLTTNNSYSSFNGTSMAAPQVAGVAALEMAFGQSLVVDGGIVRMQTPETLNPVDRLTAQALSQRTIELAWRDNSTDETGFLLLQSTGAEAWDEIAIIAPDTTAFIVDNLRCDTDYFFRVSAVLADQPSPAAQVGPSRPAACTTLRAPALLTPAHLAQLMATPNLSWNPAANAETYTVQIATNARFVAGTVVEEATLGETAFTPVTNLAEGIYFWRIRANNSAGGPGSWGAARRFTIDTTPPPVPTLSSPAADARVTTAQPTLRWLVSPTANRYRLQLANSDTFEFILFDQEATGTALLLTQSLPQGRYFWRAQARDVAGNWSDFSTARPFSVDIQLTPTPGATSLAQRPVLRWTRYLGATAYQLQLSTDTSFDDVVFEQSLAGIALTLPEALDYGRYYWRVNVIVGDQVLTSPHARLLIISPALPPAPAPQTPTNGLLVGLAITPTTLNWQTVTYAHSDVVYELQVSRASNFALPVLSHSDLAATTYQLPDTLADGVYFWRVRAVNIYGAPGPWSAVRRFTIDTTPPPVPTLASPAADARVTSARPTLRWLVSPTANRYRLQLADSDAFEFILLDQEVAGTALALTQSLPQGRYFWRVQARDAAGNWSDFSTLRPFSVDIQQTPAPGATSLAQRPVLRWVRFAGATVYQVQIATDPGFDDVVFEQSLAGIALTLPVPLDYGRYYWRVNVVAEEQLLASPHARLLIISPALPPAPVPQTPLNGGLLGPDNLPPMLSWNGSPYIHTLVTYEIQVSRMSNFASLVSQASEVNATSLEVADTLLDGIHYWRVRAVNAYGSPGPWSAIRRFTVDTTPPPVPALASPAHGAEVATYLPALSWGRSAGAVRYEVFVQAPGGEPVMVYSGAGITYRVTTPLALGPYEWAVRAVDAAGNASALSAARTFIIISPSTAVPDRQRYTTRTPSLTWSRISWAIAYEIMIDDQATFSSPEFQRANVPGDQPFVVTDPLRRGIYHWRVRAQRPDGTWSAWSAVDTFFIDVIDLP